MIKTFEDARPFQQLGANFLANNEQALLADQMRMGKTVQAILACDLLGAKKILVVCPASVKLSWRNHFLLWSQRGRRLHVGEGVKALIDPYCDVVIINYDLVIYLEIYKQLVPRSFAVGIFDEVHYLKSPDSQRTKAIFLKGALASRCTYLWPLSGTPVPNRPIEFYPMLKAMAPSVIEPYTTYGSYAKYFCGGYYDEVTRKWVVKGATNKKELGDRLRAKFMLRRTRKDVYGELDDKLFQIIPIPAEGQKLKETMARQFEWDKGEVSFGWESDGEEMATAQRELGEYKVKPCLSHIHYVLRENEKLVVFAWHHTVMDALEEGLKKYNPVVIKGGMSMVKKHESEKIFRDDPTCRVMLGNYQSAGIGLDFSSASVIVAVESSWVWGDIEQFSDRCFNFLDPQPILVQIMVIEGSLDEHKLATVIVKKDNTEETIETNNEIKDLLL